MASTTHEEAADEQGTAGGSFAASVAALAQPADHSSAEHQGLQAEPAEQLDAVADLHASPSKAEPTPAPEQSVDKPHPDHETATSELQIDDTPEPADLRAINAVMQSSEAANSDDAAASPSSAASVSQRRPSLAPRDDNDAIKVPTSSRRISLEEADDDGPIDPVELEHPDTWAPKPAALEGAGTKGTVGGRFAPPPPYAERTERPQETSHRADHESDGAFDVTPDGSAAGGTPHAAAPYTVDLKGDASTDTAAALAEAAAQQDQQQEQQAEQEQQRQEERSQAQLQAQQHSAAQMADFGIGQELSLADDPHEPPELRGLLYADGIDSMGRPVVVVNAEAVRPTTSRKEACAYMLKRLEPIVQQGPYVLVMVNTGKGSAARRLPAGWLVSAHRSLSRPFRKNVRFIILVRPSGMLKTLLAILRPFTSAKAAQKIKNVESLASIGQATNHEVMIHHLGSRFAAAAGRYIADSMAETQRGIAPSRGSSSSSQTFAMPGLS